MRLLKCICHQKTLFSSAFLLLSLFFAQAASADGRYWTRSSTTTPQYSSPDTACKSFPTAPAYPYSHFVIIQNNLAAPKNFTAKCMYLKPDGSHYSDPAVLWLTNWGSCPSGTVYNAANGTCDADPCLSTVGQVIHHEHAFRNLTAEGNPDTDPPPSICKDACQYSHTFAPFQSNRDGKRPDQILGAFEYKGNGVSCTPTASNPSNFDQPPTKPPMSPNQEYFKDSDCDAWVTGADGVRTRSCTATEYFNEPGKLNCTTSGGLMTCAVGKPSPNSTDTTKTETTTETTNADGSKNTSTNTSTTTTTCKGMAKCETSSKDETKEAGTNPDGSPGDESESCTGTDCDPEKETDKEDEEDEQCDPATDPDKCGQSSVSGEACDATVSCTGDAVQCAILRQQKIQQCADEEFREITPEKVTELKSELNSEFVGEEYAPLEAGPEGSFDFAGMIDTTGVFSRSCPNIPDLSVPWIEGTATIRLQEMSSNLCLFFTWMGYLIVAFAMRSAAEIIANGMN